MQRYVRSWNTSRHGAHIVNVRLQHSSRLAYQQRPVQQVPAPWPVLAEPHIAAPPSGLISIKEMTAGIDRGRLAAPATSRCALS
jgi:hypothetical protein